MLIFYWNKHRLSPSPSQAAQGKGGSGRVRLFRSLYKEASQGLGASRGGDEKVTG